MCERTRQENQKRFTKDRIEAYTKEGYLIECFVKERISFSNLNVVIREVREEENVYYLICDDLREYDIEDECIGKHSGVVTIKIDLNDNLNANISECEPDNSCLTIHNAYLIINSTEESAKETKEKTTKETKEESVQDNKEPVKEESETPIMLQIYSERERRFF